MMTSRKFATHLELRRRHESLYTGGPLQIAADGITLICLCSGAVVSVDLPTGRRTRKLDHEEEEFTAFTLTPDNEHLITASQNLLLRQWSYPAMELVRTWKAGHKNGISLLTMDSSSTLLATAGSDGTAKVFDLKRRYCTHSFPGHAGVIELLRFHPSELWLITSARNHVINVWDLKTSLALATLPGHVAAVTGFACLLGDLIVTVSRDKVLSVWNSSSWKKEHTFPVFEEIAEVISVPEAVAAKLSVSRDDCVLLIGDTASVWDVRRSKKVAAVAINAESPVMQALLQDQLLLIATEDHTVILCDSATLKQDRQMAGFNEEVLDMTLLSDDRLVVATNSAVIKLYDPNTWSCRLLTAHTDIVTCVWPLTEDMFVSGGKDNAVIVWRCDGEEPTVVAKADGHTASVLTVTASRTSPHMVLSAGEDTCVKLWRLEREGGVDKLVSVATQRAHDKSVNGVALSPNGRFVATASQDKTAKLWLAENLKQLGVMRGHKKGIWSCVFSPVDQVLATTSADTTLRMWSLTDFSTLKVLEGHTASVLRAVFLSRGRQFASVGSDGLLKLWMIKSNECIATYEAAEDAIWSVAVSADELTYYTAGKDGTITYWRDISAEQDHIKTTQMAAQRQEHQRLANHLESGEFTAAWELAITLRQPGRLLACIQHMPAEELSRCCGRANEEQLVTLLEYAAEWNTNSRFCHAAQVVLKQIFLSHKAEELLTLPHFRTRLEGLLPYTERHLARLGRLCQQSSLLDYTWASMKLSALDMDES